MKNFVEAMDREGSGFFFCREKLPRIRTEKLNAVIFGIREPMKKPMFDKALSKTELSARQSLKLAVTNFPGSQCGAEYEK